jgi:DNA gyrase inhibitor GyrI
MAIEKPEYEVVATYDDVEIRQYPSLIVAETLVTGDFNSAGNKAFRRLAGYIFGDNASDQKIAMTAPVTQSETADGYVVRFMMPSEHDLEDLPQPADSAVKIRQVAGGTWAVLRYKGGWSREKYEKFERELQTRVDGIARWRPIGEPTWARYNSPMMPAFLRTNEIAVPVTPR